MIRGIRGAISVDKNERETIQEASWKLVSKIVESNDIDVNDISFILFTITPDINAAFPASAIRLRGEPWSLLPCIDTRQADVSGSMKGLIRVLLTAETDRKLDEINHVYLGEAARLRPDRT